MGVSENRGPSNSTLTSRILIIRTPKQGTPNFRKLPKWDFGDLGLAGVGDLDVLATYQGTLSEHNARNFQSSDTRVQWHSSSSSSSIAIVVAIVVGGERRVSD